MFSEDISQTGYIADVMANTRKVKFKDYKTFGDFTRSILEFTFKSAKNGHRVDLVFDSYLEKSVKDSERKRRSTVSPTELNIINKDTPLPVETNRFWASGNNKLKLQMLLHQETLSMSREKSRCKQILVSCFSGISVNVSCYSSNSTTCVEVPELVDNIEEADARIIPHALHAGKQGITRIVILSSDTDIFVLLMYH